MSKVQARLVQLVKAGFVLCEMPAKAPLHLHVILPSPKLTRSEDIPRSLISKLAFALSEPGWCHAAKPSNAL